MHAKMQATDAHEIDMREGHKFVSKKYHADASFYPHGCFGFLYRGNIYDDAGNIVGDYAANDSVWIERNFQIEWR